MRGIPHILVGTGCGLLLAGPSVMSHPEIVGLAIVGSLLPDLDHEGSTASRVPVIGVVCSIAVRALSSMLSSVRPVPNPFPQVISGAHLSHRGPWHTPIMAMALYVALTRLPIPEALATAVLVGFLSHLTTDGLTRLGIAWLWPLYARVIRLPRYLSWKSGLSVVEVPLSLAILVCCLRVADPGLFSMLS